MNVDIANIIKSYILGQAFVDKIGGLVRPLSFQQGDGEKAYTKIIPIDCGATYEDCIKGKYTDLIPNSKYKSVIYFEDGGISFTDSQPRDFSFESRLKLVCWLNQSKLGKSSCSISALAILNLLKIIPDGYFNSSPYTRIKIQAVGQDQKSPSIFSKYTYDEKVLQYLLYPFDYFALNLKVNFTVPRSCIIDWTNDPETNCENDNP